MIYSLIQLIDMCADRHSNRLSIGIDNTILV